MNKAENTLNGVFVIAEIGQAHDGSLGILHSLIEAAASAGVDAVKFQMHIASAESSSEEKFRINFSYQDTSRYDYWERMELSFSQWLGIKNKCESLGVEFLVTPCSLQAVDMLLELQPNKIKVGSGDVSNFLLLEKLCQTGCELIISSGLATFSELEETVAFLKRRSVTFTLLHCTSKYPTPSDQVFLSDISKLHENFSVPVGFSDHSGKIYAGLAAVALGATMLEGRVGKHRSVDLPGQRSKGR